MWTEASTYLFVHISYLSLIPEKNVEIFYICLTEIRSYSVTSKKTDETDEMVCKVNSIFDEIFKIYT